MADLKITELPSLAGADLAATDPLAVASLAASETKKITAKAFTQKAVTLIDDASIPVAKVNLSSGISGTNLTDGTVTAAKLNTSTIPATGGLAVSSGNLGLVAPTSPIVRNNTTGSLEHAPSAASGTWSKVTVNSWGHVTAGTTLLGTDVPYATASVAGVISPGTGLSVTGAGVLNHSNSLASGITVNGVTVDQQGHVTGIVALASTDLPKASAGVRGAVSPGTGTSVNGDSVLSVTAATSSTLGGVIVGSDFAVNAGTISLIQRAGLTNNASYPKVTVTDRGIVTAGASLTSVDIPALDTSKITSGTLSIDRYGANTITGAKLANYAIGKISEAFPTADYISQLYFNPLDRTLYMWDGNVFQPIGVSYGQVVFSGTYDAGTNLITSVTTEGAAIGLTVGGALTAPVTANKSHYVVVDQPGTGTAPAPAIALSPPDMLLSNGTTWVLLDVSDTVTAQLASNIQVSPAGNIASTNVQSALQELDDEKLPLAGGTLTGNLALNTGIAIVYEGATTDNFETTLYVVDPTADRTILLPNVSGTVVTTGDTGTVTSTMLLDGTILNEDINASAAIVDTKLATIATAGKVSNSATTATSANTTSAIVARDASGNFTAGTITAALTGAASSNVLKAGDTMTGVLAVTAGTAALPAITPSGDPNTGIYSPGADQLAISTSGTGRLFVDAAGNIGVGTASQILFVDKELNVNAASGSAGFSLATGGLARVYLTGNSTAGNITTKGSIPLLFGTDEQERLRITSAGLVGIGTSVPQVPLDLISDASGYGIAVRGRSADNLGSIRFTANNYGATYSELVSGATYFALNVNGAERLRVDSSGRVGIGSTPAAGNKLHVAVDADGDYAIYGISPGASGLTGLNPDGTNGNVLRWGGVGANAGVLRFMSGVSTERARIDSSGRLLVGTPTNSGGNLLQVNSDALIYGLTVGRGAGAISTNTAIGSGALQANTTGSYNTANGYQALLSNTTGSENTANGLHALYYNTTGSYNTANGLQALLYNTTGASNTANGYQALYSNTTGSENTANGYRALHLNTTGSYNTANGLHALYYNTTGSNNTANGFYALFSNTTGAGNIGIGGPTNAGVYSPVYSTTTEDNRIVMGSTAVTNAYVQVAWTVVSDKRDKTNFAPVPHGLDFVNALKPTAYQFKYDRNSTETNGPVRYGFLAQDILALEGQNSVIIDAEDPEKLRYNGESLVPVLVNAVQELTAMVRDLQTELSILKGAKA